MEIWQYTCSGSDTLKLYGSVKTLHTCGQTSKGAFEATATSGQREMQGGPTV